MKIQVAMNAFRDTQNGWKKSCGSGSIGQATRGFFNVALFAPKIVCPIAQAGP
jgi:hypothetical protein